MAWMVGEEVEETRRREKKQEEEKDTHEITFQVRGLACQPRLLGDAPGTANLILVVIQTNNLYPPSLLSYVFYHVIYTL